MQEAIPARISEDGEPTDVMLQASAAPAPAPALASVPAPAPAPALAPAPPPLPLEFEGEYITGINFPLRGAEAVDSGDTKRICRKIWAGASRWQNIPEMAIVTGINGSGKSQLLKYIELHYTSKKYLLYISAEHRLDEIFNHGGSSTFYPLEESFEKCSTTISAWIERGNKLEEIPEEAADNFIRRIMLNQRRILRNRGETDSQYATRLILGTIDYSANDLRLNHPISFLNYIFLQYEGKVEFIRGATEEISGALDLYDDYHRREEEEEESLQELRDSYSIPAGLELRGFLELISRNALFKKELINQFSYRRAGSSPWDEINGILEKYGFKYRVTFRSKRPSDKKEICFTRRGEEIPRETLSSGEKTILSIMAWQFAVTGSNVSEDARVKVMLLDEIDKHLDPKLTRIVFHILYEEFFKRKGIQIILTTHRPDTIALMPERLPEPLSAGIFVCKQEADRLCISRATKLQAMFRITYNLREITNLHMTVYAESHDDVIFYQAAYQSLLTYCDKIRQDKERIAGYGNTPNRYWDALSSGEWKQDRLSNRLLSRRYQLSFFSTASDVQGGGGGASGVKGSVKRGMHSCDVRSRSYQSRSHPVEIRSIQLVDPILENPFGILDEDYGSNRKYLDSDKGADIRDRCEILNRHALENYLFDPFVIFSFLSFSKLGLFTNARDFQAVCLNVENLIAALREESSPVVVDLPPIDQYFSSVLKFLLENLTDIRLSKLPLSVLRICEILAPDLSKQALFEAMFASFIEIPQFIINLFKTEFGETVFVPASKGVVTTEIRLNFLELIKNLHRAIRPDVSDDVDSIVKTFLEKRQVIPIIIAADKRPISYSYPTVFLRLRGHDIETVICYMVGDVEGVSLKQYIVNQLLIADGMFIPFDLAQVFFSLNERVRNQANEVVKPVAGPSFRSPLSGAAAAAGAGAAGASAGAGAAGAGLTTRRRQQSLAATRIPAQSYLSGGGGGGSREAHTPGR